MGLRSRQFCRHPVAVSMITAALLAVPGRARSQFFSYRGHLEQGLSQYLVDTPNQSFGEGVWKQGYRLNLGGNYGLRVIDLTDFGVQYRSGRDANRLVNELGPAGENQFGYHGRIRLTLPGTKRVSVTPFYTYNDSSLEQSGTGPLRTLATVEGVTGSLNLNYLPQYQATYRHTMQETQNTLSPLRTETFEFSDRASYRLGVLEAEYEQRNQKTLYLGGGNPDQQWRSLSALVTVSDGQVNRWGLGSYYLHTAYREWDNDNGLLRTRRQNLVNNFHLISSTLKTGPVNTSLRAGQSWSKELLGAGEQAAQQVSLQTQMDSRPHRVDNRFETIFSGGEASFSENLNMSLSYFGGRLSTRWTIQENFSASSARDRITHRLALKMIPKSDISLFQSYAAVRDGGAATHEQVISLGANWVFRPITMLKTEVDYRYDRNASYRLGFSTRVENYKILVEARPLRSLTNTLILYIQDGSGMPSNMNLSDSVSWSPNYRWKLTAGLRWAGDGRAIARELQTADPRNYLNYDAGVTYQIGKTNFRARYEHNERDFRNGYHYFEASFRREF